MPLAPVHLCDELDLVVGAARVCSVRNRRDSQQDAVLVTDHLAAVADGMGGHADGARAAVAALEALAAALPSPGTMADLTDAVASANRAVCALSDGGYRNPGTTLVAVATGGDRLHGVWVGDSRAYLLGEDGTVSRLTEDHSDLFGGLVRVLGDHGRTVGATPGTFTLPYGAGLSVLLCSDGVSGPADRGGDGEAAIGELLGRGIDHLVRTLAAQGSDNATAVLVDVDRFAELAAETGEVQGVHGEQNLERRRT